MNIFYLHSDSAIAAGYQVDAHVKGGKMFLEACQMLANGFSLDKLSESDAPRTSKGTPWKHGHPNHPCTKWVIGSRPQFYWTIYHAQALLEERKLRSGKSHACEKFLDWVFDNRYTADKVFETSMWKDPPQAMPDEFKCDDTVQAYRNLYLLDKIPKLGARWTNRQPPSWYNAT